MSQSDHLSERWQQVEVEAQQELEMILANIKISGDVDHEQLEAIIYHHMRRSQESMTVLCKVLEKYHQGILDNEVMFALSQWS